MKQTTPPPFFFLSSDPPTGLAQIPSLPAAFQSHGMDLRWQGWVTSVYGIISFFVGPVSEWE